MTTIEKLYSTALDEQTGQERVLRAFALYDDVCRSLSHQVRLAEPSLSDREVRLRVARVMYLTDPRTQALLDLASAE